MTHHRFAQFAPDESTSGGAENTLRENNRVLIIGRRSLERQCLQFYLAKAGYQAHDVVSHADWLAQQGGADDVDLIIVFNDGLDQIGDDVLAVLRDGGGASVLVIAETESVEFAIEAIERGARGFIPASSSLTDLIGAIRLVAAGSVYMPAQCVIAAAKSLHSRKPEPSRRPDLMLTSKQSRVVEALRLGKPNKTIAYELNMCESTVKVHIRNVMKKLNARNRTELAFKLSEAREQV